MTDIFRRQLIRGRIRGRHLALRPPWAPDEAVFVDACDRCGDCLRACPEGVIVQGSGGFPEMDFREQGCSLCGECVTACRGKALAGDPSRDRPWDTVAEIRADCLAEKGVVCRSCGEACDERAIRFALRVGGAALPRLDAGRCTGCGCCIGVCPVKAVRIRRGAAGTVDGPREPRPSASDGQREVRAG